MDLERPDLEVSGHLNKYLFIYYYTDMSVLPKNRLLVFSIRNYIRDTRTSDIFSISSVVTISLTSFFCFSSIFFSFETLTSM